MQSNARKDNYPNASISIITSEGIE